MTRLKFLTLGLVAVTALASAPSLFVAPAKAASAVEYRRENAWKKHQGPTGQPNLHRTESTGRASAETSDDPAKLEGAQPSFNLNSTAATRHHGMATSGGGQHTGKN